jgi:hypothetical protein
MKKSAAVFFFLGAIVLAAGIILVHVRTASAQPTDIPSNAVCFYEDINYGGHYFMLYADRDYPDLRALYVETDKNVNWNDRISSLKVGMNACVTFWKDINYQNSKGVYEADGRNVLSISSLVGPGWNDKISSLKVRANGNCSKS